MNRRSFTFITMLSLILVAVCCQVVPLGHMHDAMQAMAQPLAHALLLVMDIPAGVWLSAFLMLSVVLAMGIVPIAHQSHHREARRKLYFSTPPIAPPLQLAFADGILHPKLY